MIEALINVLINALIDTPLTHQGWSLHASW
ncbi:hypothetical protein FHW67_003370 [Herbaspirillum sp. Sphag1AN]|nr:hypothetical protein [Herbaspirillum sp. Sphag1AN]MBB3247547.1 hypothetical protein [Herbaspirillum sp. Sphag64]